MEVIRTLFGTGVFQVGVADSAAEGPSAGEERILELISPQPELEERGH